MAHGKTHLKDQDRHDKDDDDDQTPPGACTSQTKQQKQSETDPESGWFHKGEHKEVFAYSIQTACDKNGWILDYTVHPGNEHDSKTFPELYEELKRFDIGTVVMDAGYKIPAIAKLILDNGQIPLFPYKSPMTKKGFFKKSEYVYDEYYDGYICPQLQMLKYSTTNREGYREYKSDGSVCAGCPDLEKCTNSKNHMKVVTRHIWQEYMDRCEDIRHTRGMKELYGRRKETIERNFGTAKEHHGMRYTQLIGKKKMRMKVGLTFACMNMKKLVRILESRDKMDSLGVSVMRFLSTLFRKSPFIGNLIWT